jgi:hypothetical protein
MKDPVELNPYARPIDLVSWHQTYFPWVFSHDLSAICPQLKRHVCAGECPTHRQSQSATCALGVLTYRLSPHQQCSPQWKHSQFIHSAAQCNLQWIHSQWTIARATVKHWSLLIIVNLIFIFLFMILHCLNYWD